MAIFLEAGHNAVGRSEAVTVVAGLERFDRYGVIICVVGEHDELFATAGADRETTHIVGVDFSD